jgi:pimeloyl-ACP methyl ester carboxylesterase
MPSGDREYRLRMGRTAPSRTTESGLVANGAGDRKRRGPAGADGLRMTPAAVAMSDGLQLSAEVVPPATPRSLGAIIFVHGFCGNKGENGLFHAIAAQCAAAGFHSVLYDWRGIAQSQGDFASTNLLDHTADFREVVGWTRSTLLDGCNPVYAVGFSLGAAVIGLALRRRLELEAVAYLSPAVRPHLSMWPRYNTTMIQRELATRGVVEKPGSPVFLGRPILESLRDTDLGPRAFELDVPLLVCHGTEDIRIDCSHSRKLVPHESRTRHFRFLEFPGASHSFRPEDDCWPPLASVVTDWFRDVPRSRQTALTDDSEREYSFA